MTDTITTSHASAAASARTWLSNATLDHARSIDGRLAVSGEGVPPRVFYVCSSAPGEGVTSLVWSQAVSLAAKGDVTAVLVDCQPGEASLSGIVSRIEGEALAANEGGEPRPTHLDNVSLATCTVQRDAKPFAELPGLVARLRDGFDQIWIDGRAFDDVSDLSALRGVVDGVILVVESEKHRAEVLTSVVSAIASSGVPVIGTILNKKKKWIPEALYKLL